MRKYLELGAFYNNINKLDFDHPDGYWPIQMSISWSPQEFTDIHIYREASTAAKVLGYIFLLLFVFLIVVVLMNLLNGLAVSDTAGIEREANIICHISKAETISYAESVLLGDPFDFLEDSNSSG